MLGPWIKQIGIGQTGDGTLRCVNVDILGISENGLEWVNLTQMTIIFTAVGKNPFKEME